MEGIRGFQHPLQTPLVLECIFKNLGVSDLKACREVCRAWRKEATPVVRPLTQVIIRVGMPGPGYEFLLSPDGRGVADFLELVQSEASTFSESPFVNDFDIINFSKAEIDPAFWEFCGWSIKSLCLMDGSFQTDDEFGHAIFQSCPNLEELIMQEVHVNSQDNGLQPEVWVPPRFPQNRNLKSLDLDTCEINGRTRMEILCHFPCLEKLSIAVAKENVYFDWIFRLLTILRERDNQGWPLKSLGLNFGSLEEPLAVLPVLVEGNLALEEFDANGFEGPKEGIVLRSILEAHVNTLKKLTLDSCIDLEAEKVEAEALAAEALAAEALEPLNNIRLEKLQFLFLNCADLSSPNFFRNVPNLRRLKIWTSCAIQGEPEDPNDDWVLTCCTEMEVALDYNELEPEELQNLLRRLPNLEKLVVYWCNNKMFATICDMCPKLTNLSLLDSEVDDCGISGLDVEDVERINQGRGNGFKWWRPITVPRPNLSNLKRLKRFSLSLSQRQADQGQDLGFSSALCGVQQLPQIQHLRMEPETCLSPTLKRLMQWYPWVEE